MLFRSSLWISSLVFSCIPLAWTTTLAQDSTQTVKIGMIGLDTSHSPAFTKMWNDKDAKGLLAKQQVTIAFPGGSHDIASSIDRVPKYVEEMKGLGVAIEKDLAKVVELADVVIITTVDGRKHLEQAIPVFKAKKLLYIDKPLAGTLVDAILIDKIAKAFGAKWFSSSSLRFSSNIWRYRTDTEWKDQIRGAISWGPCTLEATHPDLFWYGVHGVETLYTAMGTGCQQVTRVHSKGTDSVVGIWNGGRIGEFRGLRDGKTDYGLVVFGSNKIEVGGKYDGYAPLVDQVAQFFETGVGPVNNEETLEMFTFMEAADESKRKNGIPVSLLQVRKDAEATADVRFKQMIESGVLPVGLR